MPALRYRCPSMRADPVSDSGLRTRHGTGPIADLRMALNQGPLLGGSRFLDSVERITGQRRELRPGGRPGKPVEESASFRAMQLSMDKCRWILERGHFFRLADDAAGELVSKNDERGLAAVR